jgi:DNA-binding IclR family transcriptional regulator
MDPADEAGSDRNFVTALARGLDILRAYGPGDEYLGNAELAKRTGIPRPTISRLTSTLTRLGYLYYSEASEKYRLGPGVLALGYRYLAATGVRQLARPLMDKLAEETNCTIALGAPDRLEMAYVEVCQGRGPLILRMEVGSRIPMAKTSMGRAYIAGLPEPRRAAAYSQLAAAYGAEWPEIRAALDRGIEDYQKMGFCLSEGEWNREVSAVAVPLVLDEGADVMAFSCGGSAQRLTRKVLESKHGPRLRELAAAVKIELAGRGA